MCHSKLSNFFEEVPKWKIIDLDTWFRIMTFRKIRKVLKFLILLAFQVLITRNYRLDFFLEDPDQKIETRGRVSISKATVLAFLWESWQSESSKMRFFWNSPKLILTLIRYHRLIFFFPTWSFHLELQASRRVLEIKSDYVALIIILTTLIDQQILFSELSHTSNFSLL